MDLPRTRRALIVEDEITIALDLEDALSAMGFERTRTSTSASGTKRTSMLIDRVSANDPKRTHISMMNL
jgi:hypothetical protein